MKRSNYWGCMRLASHFLFFVINAVVVWVLHRSYRPGTETAHKLAGGLSDSELAILVFFWIISFIVFLKVRSKEFWVDIEEDVDDESKHHEVFDKLSFDFSCPYCLKPIKLREKRCPHCGSILEEKGEPTEPPAAPPSDYPQ